MYSTPGQIIPQDWDDARDIPFFRITATVFSSAFCCGASVLLASNDDDREAFIIAVEPSAADAPSMSVEPVAELHRT